MNHTQVELLLIYHQLGSEFSPDPWYVAGDVGVHARRSRSTYRGAVGHQSDHVPDLLRLVPDDGTIDI